jgi:hypothetical protein
VSSKVSYNVFSKVYSMVASEGVLRGCPPRCPPRCPPANSGHIARTARAMENRPQTFGSSGRNKIVNVDRSRNGLANIGILPPSKRGVPRDFGHTTLKFCPNQPQTPNDTQKKYSLLQVSGMMKH